MLGFPKRAMAAHIGKASWTATDSTTLAREEQQIFTPGMSPICLTPQVIIGRMRDSKVMVPPYGTHVLQLSYKPAGC